MKSLLAVMVTALLALAPGLSQGWADETESVLMTGPVITQKEAVLRALKTSPGLSAGAERVNATEGNLTQAKARPNPELELEIENFGLKGDTGDGTHEVTFSVAQRFERGGKRRARMSAAMSDREIARLDHARIRLDLIHDVQAAYINVLAAATRLETAENKVVMAEDLSAVVNHRARSARDPAAAQHRAEVQLLQAKATRNQAQQALIAAKKRLAFYWGAPATRFNVDGQMLFALPQPAPAFDDIAVPDLAIYTAREDKARHLTQLEKARATQDPTIRLGVRSFEDTDDVLGVVSFSMPFALFDTNRGNIARARAEERQAGFEARQAQVEFERETAILRQVLEARREQVNTMREGLVPAAERALTSLREGYKRGAFSLLEVLDAQRILLDLQDEQITLMTDLHLTAIALDRLTARYRHPLPGEETNQ